MIRPKQKEKGVAILAHLQRIVACSTIEIGPVKTCLELQRQPICSECPLLNVPFRTCRLTVNQNRTICFLLLKEKAFAFEEERS